MTETPKSDQALSMFDSWARSIPFDGDVIAAVKDRLRAGRDSYGDDSFEMNVDDLKENIREEILDIIGWAYVMRVAHPETWADADWYARAARSLL